MESIIFVLRSETHPKFDLQTKKETIA
jgi:hypothetical protein